MITHLSQISRQILIAFKGAGIATYGIGKINDIFSGQGLDDGVHTTSNVDGMEKQLKQSNRTAADLFSPI